MTNARRKQAIVGVVGLAAILGGGAYVLTDHLTGHEPATTSETGALAPVAPPPTSVAPPPASPSAPPATTPAKASAPKSATTKSPAASKSTADRVKAARDAGKRAGVKITRPLSQTPADRSVTAADLTVSQTSSGRATLKVVSARKNLAGYRELGWVADDGEPVGAAQCSQTFRFNAGMKPAEKPALLICWRTSATRSVYTIATNPDGRPSKQASVAAIDRQWERL
ncbi:hypothetical protein AB0M20_35470, partial [Actinoplanes sp. NPDC051633]|uniref:hypothetical protein n=1 Tax=Actinoplanes sp. NPDC051633 TaxID=3155670 RepID=UPI003435D0EE